MATDGVLLLSNASAPCTALEQLVERKAAPSPPAPGPSAGSRSPVAAAIWRLVALVTERRAFGVVLCETRCSCMHYYVRTSRAADVSVRIEWSGVALEKVYSSAFGGRGVPSI